MDIEQLIIDNKEQLKLEKNRLEYFANQYKTTFDMNYSPKLASKYKLTSMITPVNRCLTKQKSLKSKKKNPYNLRRVHQLYINLNRYDYAHTWTIFNYEFLSIYLLCGEYQMSDLLYQFSIGAHDPNGELRFLLKQFEISLSILNHYPNNLSFELIYRLYPFRHHLPDLTYNLLEQCLNHCPLQLLTDTERLQCLAKYSLLKIIDLTIDSQRLFVLTEDEKLYVFYHNYYGILMTKPFEIIYNKKQANEKLVSFLCQYPYICCLSSNSSMIVIDYDKRQISMQISCRKLISFVNNEIILIISSLNNSLELWHCSENQLKSQYDFPDQQIENCTLKNSLIKVIFQQSSMISYLSIDKDFQLNSIRIINENIDHYNHHILLNIHTEFYYSNDRSQTSLIIYHENNSKEIINNIDFHFFPKSVIYLPQSNSIAWLTSRSLMLFHPLTKEKFFQPFSIISSINPIDYDFVHDHYSSLEFRDQTNFLACVNQTEQIIDLFEWRYDNEQHKHIYRQLTRLQLDHFIDRFVFTASRSSFSLTHRSF
jgi:hypothetical protein